MLKKSLRAMIGAGFAMAGLCAFGAAVQACDSKVRITFFEDSPDFFLVEFKDKARFQIASLSIDLTTSVGRAFVDTAYGREPPRGPNDVILDKGLGFVDGSRKWTLTFKRFLPGQKFRLLVDLDDAAMFGAGDPDHLTDGELLGASAQARLIGADGKAETITGRFNRAGVATLGQEACA